MILQRSWIYFLFLLCLGSFFFAQDIFAATITFQNGKASLSGFHDEYTIDVSLSINAQDNIVYYLRGVFYKSGTTNYCGLTWNGSSWFGGPYSSNQGWKQFLPITISNNAWSGQLKATLDNTDSGCITSGTYNFKIQRFTANSSSGTFDTQTEQTLTVAVPTSTPTQSPTATPNSTPTHSPSATPTNKPTSIPVQSIAKMNTPTEIAFIPTNTVSESAILGTSSAISRAPESIPVVKQTKVAGIQGINILPYIFISGGSLLLLGCGILMFLTSKKIKKETIIDE